MMQDRKAPIIIVALSLGVLASAGSRPMYAGQQSTPAPTAPVEQQDLAALVQAVDTASGGTLPTDGVPLNWLSSHFIRSVGDSVYVPFTVSVDRSQLVGPTAAFYVRVVRRPDASSESSSVITLAPPGATRPSYPWDTMHYVEVPADGRVSRAVALPPGTYDAYIAIKSRSAGADAPASPVGILRHELVVPTFSDTELATSDILLAHNIEPLAQALSGDQQLDNPYVFGALRVTPALDAAFLTSQNLQVLFYIYGASQTGGKPNVQIDFSFYHDDKYFNKTAPQDLNAETLPPEFNLTAGHQLVSSLAIPLKSFPPGKYRLEVTVTDKPSGKTLTRNVAFTVSAA